MVFSSGTMFALRKITVYKAVANLIKTLGRFAPTALFFTKAPSIDRDRISPFAV
jgi:hypothetical protein